MYERVCVYETKFQMNQYLLLLYVRNSIFYFINNILIKFTILNLYHNAQPQSNLYLEKYSYCSNLTGVNMFWGASVVAYTVKNMPAMLETRV